MKSLFACLPALLPAFAMLSACSARGGASDSPDFSTWLNNRQAEVLVAEVATSTQCNSGSEESSLTLLRNSAAVKAWEASRGVSLSGVGELPVGPYVAVDLGRRGTGGYGVAVNRRAGLKKGTFVLQATVFEPGPEDFSAPGASSPCALVRLPAVSFESMTLVDQAGRLRAGAAGFSASVAN